MARPIRDTPTLRGKAARRFLRRMKEVEKGKRKPTAEIQARMEANYNKLNSLPDADGKP